jgi:hypothetical protein
MADPATTEEIADAMEKQVAAAQGLKKLKPGDLVKMMIELFGDDRVDKKACKLAIKMLIETERCVYTYFGGSFIEMPHKEGAEN